MSKRYVLGIDTSNYCTSIAVIDDENNIVASAREILDVRKGQRGLRQSEALFQHLNKLPRLIEEIMKAKDTRSNIKAVAVSVAPRDAEGSYMPCFLTGKNMAEAIASTLGIPLIETYHQNGHMAAALLGSEFRDKDKVIGFHFSGGTTEALLKQRGKLQLLGGTKDISFGQLIDRIGVKLGYEFPAGKFLDEILMRADSPSVEDKIKELGINKPTDVTVKDGYFNLSGIETSFYKIIDALDKKKLHKETKNVIVAKLVFDAIADTICQFIKNIDKKHKKIPMILFGGVMESQYLRNKISEYCKRKQIEADFAKKGLSSDNAVGIAYLGGKQIWHVNP